MVDASVVANLSFHFIKFLFSTKVDIPIVHLITIFYNDKMETDAVFFLMIIFYYILNDYVI